MTDFLLRIDDQIRLRILNSADSGDLFDVVRANLEDLMEWLPWATDEYSAESASEFISSNLKSYSEGGAFAAGVTIGDRIGGMVGFHNLDRTHSSVDLGYWLAAEARGRGVMTSCCKAMVDYAFDELGVNRVQVNCNVENVKSRGIPERLGFKHEGTLREVERLHGRFCDWAIYGMLADEWMNR